MRAMRAAWFLVLCLACGGEERTSASSESSETDESSEAATQAIQVGDLSVALPSAWQPAPEEQTARLIAAGSMRDPGANVMMKAFVSRRGLRAPDFSLSLIEQTPSYSADARVVDSVDDLRIAITEQAQFRGIQSTFEPDCGPTHCDIAFGLIGEIRTTNRLRVWKADGRLTTYGCTCFQEACEHIDECRFPDPPADARPVDQT